MAGEQAATLRAQWLGQQLRTMREAAGLTLKDVGEYINRNAGTVSRMESGFVSARVPEVLAYLDICGIEDARRREDLKFMAQDAWRKGWWDRFKGDVVGSLIDWIWLESRAVEINSFQTNVVPGLLQTRDYAEALIRVDPPNTSEKQITRFVNVRMTRQERLAEEDPLRLSAVLEEGALRRLVGGPEVMHAQLTHLIKLAHKPHIEVMVLPSNLGAHASPDGSFDVFRMRPPYPVVGGITTAAGHLVVEGDEAEALVRTYDRLRNAALQDESAVAFIFDLAKRLE